MDRKDIGLFVIAILGAVLILAGLTLLLRTTPGSQGTTTAAQERTIDQVAELIGTAQVKELHYGYHGGDDTVRVWVETKAGARFTAITGGKVLSRDAVVQTDALVQEALAFNRMQPAPARIRITYGAPTSW